MRATLSKVGKHECAKVRCVRASTISVRFDDVSDFMLLYIVQTHNFPSVASVQFQTTQKYSIANWPNEKGELEKTTELSQLYHPAISICSYFYVEHVPGTRTAHIGETRTA